MSRLRRPTFRSWLPLLVAAVACRALAPAGFMTVADSPTPVIAGTLCSLDKERRERLSIPHDAPQSNHCDHCLGNPMGWAPIAFLRLDAAPSTPQLAHAPPLRKQSPGAPPPA